MKKVLLIPTFFMITPILIISSVIFLTYLTYLSNPSKVLSSTDYKSYAALPAKDFTIKDKILQDDSRSETLSQFLLKYNSPLQNYSNKIISEADKYDLDWRLLPAIAMQESTLCNNLPDKLKDTYNCWGFGIYGKKVTSFANYDEAIETITKALALNYKAQGLTTPSEIMSKYTPSSNGSWAQSVSLIMSHLE